MALFLSVAESLKYWRSDAPYYLGSILQSPSPNTLVHGCGHTKRELDRHPEISSDNGSPIELLVGSQSDNRQDDLITTRLITYPLPEGSFYEIYHDAFVCSPELTFLLAATRVPLRGLIALGCELCGTYSLFSKTSTSIRRPRIASVATIGEYLDCVPGMHGVKLARRALGHLADNSASPRETDIYMQYCISSKLGSFGFKGVQLNSKQPVKGSAKKFTDMEEITPDLYWPEYRIAVEYESTEDHGAYAARRDLVSINQRKLAADSTRRRTYEAMGILPVTITNGEFVHFSHVERIAKFLARRMGKHGIRGDLNTTFHRSELHEWLKIPAEMRSDVI